MLQRFAPLVLGSTLALAGLSSADTIFLTDGTSIDDVQVTEETLKAVTYKESKDLQSVPSESVARVEFSKLPRALDQVATALYDSDYELASKELFSYVKGILDGDKERKAWAPAYAIHQLIEVSQTLGDRPGVVEAADVMIKHYGDSRYVAEAYLSKARALYEAQQLQPANETLQAFKLVIDKEGLSAGWNLQCELALIQTNSELRGKERRAALRALEVQAGEEFPRVTNGSKLARGEAMVAEAASAADADAAKLLSDASALFEGLIGDDSVEDGIRAGAYTGLGDALFQSADGAPEVLKEAGMNYLRVVATYKKQSRYVPKALYYSGRCFDQLETPEEKRMAKQLYRRIVTDYPESTWAQDAKRWL